MNRRHLIKAIAVSAGGMLALPAWATGWTLPTLLPLPHWLTTEQDALLTDIVGIIIPEGTTPGAVSLGVPQFIQKMLIDCYEPAAQADFQKGLDAIDNRAKELYQQAFTAMPVAQKQALLTGLSNSTDAGLKAFYTLLKSLTIQGYTTSEYVLVNHLNYVMAPGHYHGCVPV